MNNRKQELIGWAVFMVGFLTAAATSMRKPPLWSVFVPALIVSVVGALMARHFAALAQADSAEAAKAAKSEEGGVPREAGPMLDAMLEALGAIDPDGDTEDIQGKIEALQQGLVTDFVEERRSFLLAFGPIHFSHFFGAFAKGERNINRAWSALVDEHQPEMKHSLELAVSALEEAREQLGKAGEEEAPTGAASP